MIDKVCSVVARLNMPAEVKAPLLAQFRQVPEGRGVSGQNTTLYRACAVVHRTIAPSEAADWICQLLYGLAVPVDRQTVMASIRQNRNKPIELATGEIEPLEVTP